MALAFSPEPMTLYQISRKTGIAKSSVKYTLDLLLSEGHVVKLEDGRYVVNPDYVYVYDGVAIYRFSDTHYLLIMPDYDDLSEEEIAKKITNVMRRLPASVRLWIEMFPAPRDN